jgi:hypothetical protein
MPSARSGYAIVAVLLIAAAGAFLRAEQLKLTLSPVARPAPPQHFSPVCTGNPRCQTEADLRFTLRAGQRIELAIVDSSGGVVRTLTPAGGTLHGKGVVTETWDGNTDAGGRAPDGAYRLRVTLPASGKTITIPNRIVLDTTPPTLTLVSAPGRVPVLYRSDGRVYLILVSPSGKMTRRRGHDGRVTVPQSQQVSGTTMTLIAQDKARNRSAPVPAGTIS